jgi:hypothetical protein
MPLTVVLFSTLIFLFCACLWLALGEKRLASPIFLYLCFHLLGFVTRPWILRVNGDEWYLHNWVGIWPYAQDYEKALWLANIGLIMLVVGGLIGERWARARAVPTVSRILPKQVVVQVGIALILLGALSYLRYGVLPGQDPASRTVVSQGIDTAQGTTAISTTSAYITNLHVLTIGVFIVFLAMFGLRWYFVAYLSLYFATIIYQGFSRTTYLVGVITLVIAVMSRRGKRWPSWKAGLVLLTFLLSFLAGKAWLQTLLLQGSDAGFSNAQTTTSQSLGQGDFFLNFDMLVTVTYLVPDHVPYSDVQLYFRPFYFWIPRAVWSDKPIFDFAAAYIAQNAETVTFRGLTTTLVGESYLSFGTLGVVVLMLGYGVTFGYVHVRTFLHPAASVERFFGIAMVAALFQVYRDGIVSLNQYVLYYFGPCALMWGVSVLLGKMHYVESGSEGPSDAPPKRESLNRTRIVVGS